MLQVSHFLLTGKDLLHLDELVRPRHHFILSGDTYSVPMSLNVRFSRSDQSLDPRDEECKSLLAAFEFT